MTPIDYGLRHIEAFGRAARAGDFHFDPAAVDEVVRSYNTMIEELDEVAARLRDAEAAAGFGTVPSAEELRRGFSRKASDGLEVVAQLVDGAMRLQEAYLRAAQRFADADRVGARRIARATAALDITD
ncbi:hypothetical protein ACWEQ0_26050 [Nocardia thailandica]